MVLFAFSSLTAPNHPFLFSSIYCHMTQVVPSTRSDHSTKALYLHSVTSQSSHYAFVTAPNKNTIH
jgi:hypothetical protein